MENRMKTRTQVSESQSTSLSNVGYQQTEQCGRLEYYAKTFYCNGQTPPLSLLRARSISSAKKILLRGYITEEITNNQATVSLFISFQKWSRFDVWTSAS